ncbi:MAG: 3'-5' exonuclease [Aquificae bacterium]|nr:3'-5' exonuclease [Aquificota bacterium]
MYRLTIDEAVFTVIDLETTGFNPENNSIIEIAAIKYQGNIIVDKFWQLVKPDFGLLPSHITQLTGITNAMVVDQPKIEDVLPDFLRFIKNTIIVGHNVGFDLSFLNYNLKKLNKQIIKNPHICTDALARRIMPDIDSKSLSNLAYHFNIPFPKQHRAMSDAEVTLKVFLKMLDFLQDYNVNRVIDIIKLSEGKKINYKEKRKRYV